MAKVYAPPKASTATSDRLGLLRFVDCKILNWVSLGESMRVSFWVLTAMVVFAPFCALAGNLDAENANISYEQSTGTGISGHNQQPDTYGTAASSPSGGNTSGASHSQSGSGGSPSPSGGPSAGSPGEGANSGNNPGNPNAEGYFGGKSTTSPSTSSASIASLDSVLNTEMGSNVNRSAQFSGIDQGNKLAEAVKEMGATAAEQREAWVTGYYHGVFNSFVEAKVDPYTQSITSGKMHGEFRASGQTEASVSPEMLQAVKDIDALSRKGSAAIIGDRYAGLPSGTVSVNGGLIDLNGLTALLSPQEKLAMQLSITVFVPLEKIDSLRAKFGAPNSVYGFQIPPGLISSKAAIGGVSVVAVGHRGWVGTTRHELRHAAVDAVKTLAPKALENFQTVDAKVRNAFEALTTVVSMATPKGGLTSFDKLGVALPAGVSVPRDQTLSKVEEAYAYLSSRSPSQFQSAVDHLSSQMSPAEARAVATEMANSPTLNAWNSSLDRFSQDMLDAGQSHIDGLLGN